MLVINKNMISLSAEFVRIALGILRTHRESPRTQRAFRHVPDIQVTMSFGIILPNPDLTVKLLSTVSGLRLSAAARRPAQAQAQLVSPAAGLRALVAGQQQQEAGMQQPIPVREPEVASLNTADPLALLTFVESATRTDRLFNVLLRVEAFPNTPPLEEGVMRQLIMALHPYKHGWTVDTVLPLPQSAETLIADGPGAKPSVMWMNRYDDDLFDEGTAKRIANEFDIWIGLGLGLNKYSEDDIQHEFIHVDDDLLRLESGNLVHGRIMHLDEDDDWKGWELLPKQP